MNLDQLLTGARDEIAQATAPIDDRTLTRVRGTVRRARIQRHTFESVGAAACAGVLGLGAWTLTQSDSTTPVDPATRSATPDPSSAPTADPTPSSAPTTAPDDGPVERAAEIDDATVLARLAAPRTGERWHDEPMDASDALDALFTADELANGPEYHLYLVGDREASAIYALAFPAPHDDVVAWGTHVELYEIDEDGPRAILCPSARTGDACADEFSSSKAVADRDTFYDTLTLPAELGIGEDWVLPTAAARADAAYVGGIPAQLAGADEQLDEVARLGALQVVRRDLPSSVDALSSYAYAVRTPFGTIIPIPDADVPGLDYLGITWDDGVDRSTQVAAGDWARYAQSPAGSTCTTAQFAVEDQHVAAQWRTAGRTADGRDVVVPVSGSPLAAAVHSWHLENSGTLDPDSGAELRGLDAGYRYATVGEFLDAQSLYGVQGPGGEWHLHLRPEATNVVYECA